MEQKANIEAMCIPENMSYTTDLYTNYLLIPDEESKTRVDLRKYNFPLSDQAIQAIAQRNRVSTEEVAKASFGIASGVVRDYKISEYIKSKEIKSTLRYHFYKSVTDGGTVVYTMTDGLIPLSEIWRRKDITMGFVIDIARRLYAICVDLDRIGVTHRNINPYNIFFTADTNRLVLGGFNCAMLPDETKPVVNPYVYRCHEAPAIKAGERGDLTTDVYSIASIMGCFFEGTDITQEYQDTLPAIVPPSIREAIELGRSLNPDNLPQFRKALNHLYREAHGLYWETPIHTCYQRKLEAGPSVIDVIRKSTLELETSNKPHKRVMERARKKNEKVGRRLTRQKSKEQTIDEEYSISEREKNTEIFRLLCSFFIGVFVMLLIILVIGYLFGYVGFE